MRNALGAALLILGSYSATAAENCFFGDTGQSCKDAGFAYEASQRCPNVETIIDPDETMMMQPRFEDGRNFFGVRAEGGLDKACAAALRAYGTNAIGVAIIREKR